jgi:hypothetical protein
MSPEYRLCQAAADLGFALIAAFALDRAAGTRVQAFAGDHLERKDQVERKGRLSGGPAADTVARRLPGQAPELAHISPQAGS